MAIEDDGIVLIIIMHRFRSNVIIVIILIIPILHAYDLIIPCWQTWNLITDLKTDNLIVIKRP